jgi:hypothetical protein
VNPLVSGDQSPHSTFGLRPAWSCFALVALSVRSMKHPITGKAGVPHDRNPRPDDQGREGSRPDCVRFPRKALKINRAGERKARPAGFGPATPGLEGRALSN